MKISTPNLKQLNMTCATNPTKNRETWPTSKKLHIVFTSDPTSFSSPKKSEATQKINALYTVPSVDPVSARRLLKARLHIFWAIWNDQLVYFMVIELV